LQLGHATDIVSSHSTRFPKCRRPRTGALGPRLSAAAHDENARLREIIEAQTKRFSTPSTVSKQSGTRWYGRMVDPPVTQLPRKYVGEERLSNANVVGKAAE
jgi:hypothetical protein